MKRLVVTLFILILCISILAGCSKKANNDNLEIQNPPKEEDIIIDYGLNDTNKIEILYDGKLLMSIKDKKLVEDIVSMVNNSGEYTYDKRLRNRPTDKVRKLVFYSENGDKKEVFYKSDFVYEIGYIEIDDKRLEPDYSLFRYIEDLQNYEEHDTDIKEDVIKLFDKYDWTADYKVNTFDEKLPENLKHSAGEFPIKIYWAYNNELSKEIKLDFSKYLGEEVQVEMYRLRETLPEFMKPRTNARGVILRHGENIVGAYIDAGRHSGFACSINRKTLEEVTNKQWGKWLEDYIDYDDEAENYLKNKKPEEIIEEYYKALDEDNKKMIYASMTRKSLVTSLFINMNNNRLFNEGYIDSNIKAVELQEIKKWNIDTDNKDRLEYMITVDFDFKEMITGDSGVSERFITLKKEVNGLGWRIQGIGTGP